MYWTHARVYHERLRTIGPSLYVVRDIKHLTNPLRLCTPTRWPIPRSIALIHPSLSTHKEKIDVSNVSRGNVLALFTCSDGSSLASRLTNVTLVSTCPSLAESFPARFSETNTKDINKGCHAVGDATLGAALGAASQTHYRSGPADYVELFSFYSQREWSLQNRRRNIKVRDTVLTVLSSNRCFLWSKT